ncbi:hypothetical protein [Occallatibacter savannae]|uniref:hypothetical protein n=1 Tax=Occallatibacter savannae TaxID=1002691 RepID=UPI000D68B01A|nr:hypothetical protein [Occallatibacter savannae]
MDIGSLRLFCQVSLLSSIPLIMPAQDLHFKKSISINGNTLSTSETWVSGKRERTVTASPAGDVITLHQCDLKRTISVNDAAQSYFIQRDPEDEAAMRAAALVTGQPAPGAGGAITQTVTVTDTGERKQMSGYAARHLKTRVIVEPSADACTKTKQDLEIDGWYADLSKEPLSCSQGSPPIRQGAGCNDRVIVHRKGTGKPGYPLHETITMRNDGDEAATNIEVVTSEISKQASKPELFDVPSGYKEVHSEGEIYTAVLPQAGPVTTAQASAPVSPSVDNAMVPQGSVAQGAAAAMTGGMAGKGGMPSAMSMLQMMGGKFGGLPQQVPQQNMTAGTPMPIPQALGPKAPGRIRIGVAPAQAQLGQGNNSQQEYGTPVRNAIILMMSGPAIEIAAIDARIPIQMQAEAQQKQCDYLLLSSVTVKRNASTGFGKLMKAGSMASNFTPIGMMAHTMSSVNGAMAAAQTAGAVMQQTAAISAQQQAMNQLSGFNGQIKSKDEVTVEYQLLPTGQVQPKLDTTLKGKSKTDGEDVLTPLIQQAATTVLTEVSKK